MKLYTLPLVLLLLNFSCTKSDTITEEANLPAKDLMNVAYGGDYEQKMDISLPANRTSKTKVLVLIHGGGWSGGSKADMAYFVPQLRVQFPDYAIVNMDYRLGTAQSPAFPKQIQDIEKMVEFLKKSDYQISDDYAFIGASAGAHLAMLYSYKYDTAKNVKAVCSIVGPADFLDPSYTTNPLFQYGLIYLIGNANFQQNPELFIEVSPVTHVSTQSPPTIMFYGGQDPLIPATQGPRLKEKLDQFGVYNELHMYPNGGHGNWDAVTALDFQQKLVAFIKAKF